MSSSDYLTAKKKLILYNTTSTRSTNNTNLSNSIANSSSINGNRYYATREELTHSNSVNCYEKYIENINLDLDNDGIKLCNVKNTYNVIDGINTETKTINAFERTTH